MTNRFMISVAALALIAGTGMANAQGAGKESGGAAGGAMQHSAPADNSAGASRSEASEPKGGMKSSQSEQKQPGAMKNERAEDNVKGGSTSQRAEDRAKGSEGKGMDTRQRADDNMKSGRDRDNMKTEGRDKNAPSAAENKSTTERTQTTGQAGAGAKLTSEQRTKISSVIKSQHVESVNNVNFSVTVGTRVPREGVRLHALPSEVVTIYPEWRGYEFIRVRDQILVIDPNTYEIVAVLEA